MSILSLLVMTAWHKLFFESSTGASQAIQESCRDRHHDRQRQSDSDVCDLASETFEETNASRLLFVRIKRAARHTIPIRPVDLFPILILPQLLPIQSNIEENKLVPFRFLILEC